MSLSHHEITIPILPFFLFAIVISRAGWGLFFSVHKCFGISIENSINLEEQVGNSTFGKSLSIKLGHSSPFGEVELVYPEVTSQKEGVGMTSSEELPSCTPDCSPSPISYVPQDVGFESPIGAEACSEAKSL